MNVFCFTYVCMYIQLCILNDFCMMSCIKLVHQIQFHAVFYTQQGRQREPSVKILRSPLSTGFWRHCVLSGRTQRRALPLHQSEGMEI